MPYCAYNKPLALFLSILIEENIDMNKTIQAVTSCIFLLAIFISHFSVAAESTEEASSASNNNYTYSYSRNYHNTATTYLYLDDSGSLQKKVPGVGSGLANMLDSLMAITGSSENRFKQLINYFPSLIPDLHRVFITL